MSDSSQPIRNHLSKINKKNSQADLSTYVFGKIPPQARDLEEAVLGALMIDKDAVTNIIDILKPESFYLDAHQKVYSAMLRLFERNEPVDLLTVTEELRKEAELESVGGAYFLNQLTNRVASAANVEFHARIISQKFIQRELIRICSDVVKEAYEDTTDVFDLLDKAETEMYNVTEKNLRRSYDDMSHLISMAIKEIDEVRKHEDSLTGIPSGFLELDRYTAGWQRSDLIIIAARPGMGKTAFTLALTRNAAVDHSRPIAFFSLEMSSIQLVKRLISSETELSGEKIRRGDLADHEWFQLTKLTGKLSEAKIFIDDTPAINIFEFRAKCRRLKLQHDIQMVIIDYLQLMSGSPNSKAGNREQEISNISRALKSIAKELDIPVIALSQLNRSVESRTGTKRPQLSDLRESGAIEQDADMVIFLFRPEYYQMNEDEEGNSLAGIAEVIIAKHRNGALGTVKTRFVDKFAKFVNLDDAGSDFGNFTPISSITRSSRMDELEDEEDPDAPF